MTFCQWCWKTKFSAWTNTCILKFRLKIMASKFYDVKVMKIILQHIAQLLRQVYKCFLILEGRTRRSSPKLFKVDNILSCLKYACVSISSFCILLYTPLSTLFSWPTFSLFLCPLIDWYINREAAFPDNGVEPDNKEIEGCCNWCCKWGGWEWWESSMCIFHNFQLYLFPDVAFTKNSCG